MSSPPQYYHPRWELDRHHNSWFYRDSNNHKVFYDPARDHLVTEYGHRTSRSPRIVPPRMGTTPATWPQSPSTTAAYTSARPPPPESTSSQGEDASLASTIGRIRLDAPPSTTQQSPPAHASRAGWVRPQVYEQQGVRVVDAQNPDSGVRTTFATRPADRITDPELLPYGMTAQRKLLATPGEYEPLYTSFKLQRSSFFRVGRVFLILWSEPAGESATEVTFLEPTDALRRGVFTGRHGEQVYSKVRRFVVVREGRRYCTALPIMSYGHQGVGKSGIVKSEHAIIYTGPQAPPAKAAEEPDRDELPMRPQSIRVVPDVPTDKLDPMSRINFGKFHTVEHNLKVKSVGMVHPSHLQALVTQWYSVVVGSNATMPGHTAGAGSGGVSLPRAGDEDDADRAAGASDDEAAAPNDDDDEGDGDNDDTANTDARRRRPSSATRQPADQPAQLVDQLVNRGWSRDQATEHIASMQTYRQYTAYQDQGHSKERAIQALTSAYQRSMNVSQQTACSRVRARLAYASQRQGQ